MRGPMRMGCSAVRALAVGVAFLLVAPVSFADDLLAGKEWQEGFRLRYGELGILQGFSIERLDLGDGPAIYVGGPARFDAADERFGDVLRLADGAWEPLGVEQLEEDGAVSTTTVFDEGSGPVLFAGGEFEARRDGTYLGHLARWDGSTWQPVGGAAGVGFAGFQPAIRELLVHDDGSGPALFVAGCFESVGETAATGIVKWDGSTWTALPPLAHTDFRPCVLDLEVDEDGTLLVGGIFDSAQGQPTWGVARWDGTSWTPVGPPPGPGDGGLVFTVLPARDEEPLCIGGDSFRMAGQWVGSNLLCLFDETSPAGWETIGTFEDDGSSFPRLGGSIVSSLDRASDRRMIVITWGGDIVDGVRIHSIGTWRGGVWSAFEGPQGRGVEALFLQDLLLEPLADGKTSLWIVGVRIYTAGGVRTSGIARWAPCDGPCAVQVFADGFESGDLAAWSVAR